MMDRHAVVTVKAKEATFSRGNPDALVNGVGEMTVALERISKRAHMDTDEVCGEPISCRTYR